MTLADRLSSSVDDFRIEVNGFQRLLGDVGGIARDVYGTVAGGIDRLRGVYNPSQIGTAERVTGADPGPLQTAIPASSAPVPAPAGQMNLMPILLIGGAALAAFFLLQEK